MRRSILVTGGTGFVGSFLIRDLLKDGHNVYMLVRDVEKADKVMTDLGVFNRHRLHMLVGDISKPNLGLSEIVVRGLSTILDVVYHSAATVKFNDELRDDIIKTNLEGTRNVLEFSKVVGVSKFLHVSTAYVLGNRGRGIEHLYDVDTTAFRNPYDESKCRAEHLVFSYGEDFEVSIYRPSIIIGDQYTGEANSEFAVYGMLRGMRSFKKRIERNEDWNLKTYRLAGDPVATSNVVPIDYVVDCLVAGLEFSVPYGVYNVTNPNPPRNTVLLDALTISAGIPNAEFLVDVSGIELTKEEKFVNNVFSVFEEFLRVDIDFDNTETELLLRDAGKSVLRMTDEQFIGVIVNYK